MNALLHSGFFKSLQKPTIVFAFWRGSQQPFSSTIDRKEFPSPASRLSLGNPSSEMADYLVNSCGFSSEAAAVVSTKLGSAGSIQKASKTIDLFREASFTGNQITKAITRCPSLLASSVDKTLKPKIKFLHDCGLSDTDIAQMVSENPVALKRSLQNYVLPVFEVIKGFIPDEVQAAKSMKGFFSRQKLPKNVHERIPTNMSYLQRCGLPERSLMRILTKWPRLVALHPSALEKIFGKVGELGFSHDSDKICDALFMVYVNSSLLAPKLELLKSFGWIPEQTMEAIHKYPLFLIRSLDALREKLEYFIHKLGFDPGEIAACPTFLSYSLETRVIPRVAVMRALDSQGLEKKYALISVLTMKTELFYERFVLKHRDECPDMFEAYVNSTKVRRC